MKILVHDYSGHSFPIQLSRQLAQSGHEVMHVYAGYNTTPRGPLSKDASDNKNFSIKPIFIKKPLKKYRYVKRWFQQIEYGRLLAREIEKYKADVVISSNTPLDAQKACLRASQKTNSLFVFWLQDFIGLATYLLLRNRLPIAGGIIGRYYISLEKKIFKQSDQIVAISDDFAPILTDWGVDPERISVIPNWAAIEKLPVSPKSNQWSRQLALDHQFCFMYTGTLGLKHNPDLLLQLAIHFKDDESISIVVISEGPGAEWLAKEKSKNMLKNLLLLPYQPFEMLSDVMASADVLIAILEKDAGLFSVPSKVLSYLCSARPILAALPKENLSAKIILRGEAGYVVDPDQTESFIKKAEHLFSNPDERSKLGLNGRKFAEKNFNINEIANKFLEIFRNEK